MHNDTLRDMVQSVGGFAIVACMMVVAGCFDHAHPSGDKFQKSAAFVQRWEVKEVNTLKQVQALAREGWEPYASYNDNDANQHMLRRKVGG